MPTRLAAFGLTFGIAALTVYLLVEGRSLLIPFAIAVMIWYLINALKRTVEQRTGAKGWVSMTLSIVAIVVGIALIVQLISGNIAAVSAAAPNYQANVEKFLESAMALVGMDKVPSLQQLTEQFDVRSFIRGVAGAAADVAGNTGLIIIYVLFLLIEQRTFRPKIRAIFTDRQREREVIAILDDIQRRTQAYVAVKTILSVATGVVSWVILVVVGVDFAGFWAFLIFLLNYIPTIGSLIGVVFPALLTLVQFATAGPFLVVTIGLGLTQFVFGNVLEPRMMGKSLNLSPLVVIVSLAVWGSIWGVTGMFLCVPITVVMMIVLAEFPQTRPIAILLSATGRIETPEHNSGGSGTGKD
jgi:AI-2 transport protein TqsA